MRPVANILLLAAATSAVWAYSEYKARSPAPEASEMPEYSAPNQSFKCDGREYCSQMNSRAEAEFFTRNCPNTKMDGDGDGVPCENDSRW
jgi:hypothetical protein